MRNDFEPLFLKKSHKALDKHIEAHTYVHESYKKKITKSPNLWKKIKQYFHLKS